MMYDTFQAPPPRDAGRRPSVHDGLAVASFVLSFLLPPVGFILGCVSVSAAHRDGRRASGLAVAAIVLGVIVTVITVAVVVSAVAAANDPYQQYINCVNSQLGGAAVQCTPPSN